MPLMVIWDALCLFLFIDFWRNQIVSFSLIEYTLCLLLFLLFVLCLFLFTCLKNGTYYVTGHGVHPSVNFFVSG